MASASLVPVWCVMITKVDVCVALNAVHIYQTKWFLFKGDGESPLSEATDALGRADEEQQSLQWCTAIVCVVPKNRKRTLLASSLIVLFWNANHFHVAMDNYEFSYEFIILISVWHWNKWVASMFKKWDFDEETFTYESFSPEFWWTAVQMKATKQNTDPTRTYCHLQDQCFF